VERRGGKAACRGTRGTPQYWSRPGWGDGARNLKATARVDDSSAPAGADLGGVRIHGLRSSTRSTRGYIPRPHPGPKNTVHSFHGLHLNPISGLSV
jgi:hypothetical protein